MKKVILLVALAAITSASHATEWTQKDREYHQSLYEAGDRDGIKNHIRVFHGVRVAEKGGFTVEQTLALHRKTDQAIRNGQ